MNTPPLYFGLKTFLQPLDGLFLGDYPTHKRVVCDHAVLTATPAYR